MEKTLGINIASLALVLLFIFAIFPTVNGSSAEAVYGSYCNQSSAAKEEMEDTCDMIIDAFISYSSCTCHVDACGSGTYASNVYYYAQYFEDNYDYATVFHYGHISVPSEIYGQLWIRYSWDPEVWYYEEIPIFHHKLLGAEDYSGIIVDKDLYSYTDAEEHKFVFMWACENQSNIGGYDPGGGYNQNPYYSWPYVEECLYYDTGAYGLPYAWMHRGNGDLSWDGYASPDQTDYCYIGFNDTSPAIEDFANGQTSKTYGDWITYFYYSALYNNNYSIKDALNAASQYVYGVNYGACPLYLGDDDWYYHEGNYYGGNMVVFGNSNNLLPT